MTAVNPNKSRHAMGPRGEPIEKGSMELLNGSNLPRFKVGPFFFFFSPPFRLSASLSIKLFPIPLHLLVALLSSLYIPFFSFAILHCCCR